LPCSCLLGRGFIPSGRNFGPATCHGDEKDFRIFLHANYESMTIGRPVNKKNGVYSFFTSFLKKASCFDICMLVHGNYHYIKS
jgi:hypothetical protein